MDIIQSSEQNADINVGKIYNYRSFLPSGCDRQEIADIWMRLFNNRQGRSVSVTNVSIISVESVYKRLGVAQTGAEQTYRKLQLCYQQRS